MEGLQTHKAYHHNVQRMSSCTDIGNIDYKTRRRSNKPPFVWMRGVLHDQLGMVAAFLEADACPIGTETKRNCTGNRNFVSDTFSINNKPSVNVQHKPYVMHIQVGPVWQDKKFTKGKGAVIGIAINENDVDSPESKPYPVIRPKDTTKPGDNKEWPSIQRAFELYKQGDLKLNLLYLFWGKNLGVHFFETVFDLVTCYQSFGRTTFKIAIECMIESLALPSCSLPEFELESDLNVLAALSDAILD